MLKLVRVALFWPEDGARTYVLLFGWIEAVLHHVGGGPAVVLLHPTPVDHRFWMPVAEILRVKIPSDCAGSAGARAVGAGGRSHHGREAGCRCGAAAGSSGDWESAVRRAARSADTRCSRSGGRCRRGSRGSRFAVRRRRRTRRRGGRSATETIAKVRERGTAEFIEVESGDADRVGGAAAVAGEGGRGAGDDAGGSGGIDCGGAAGAGGAAGLCGNRADDAGAVLRDCGGGGSWPARRRI